MLPVIVRLLRNVILHYFQELLLSILKTEKKIIYVYIFKYFLWYKYLAMICKFSFWSLHIIISIIKQQIRIHISKDGWYTFLFDAILLREILYRKTNHGSIIYNSCFTYTDMSMAKTNSKEDYFLLWFLYRNEMVLIHAFLVICILKKPSILNKDQLKWDCSFKMRKK